MRNNGWRAHCNYKSPKDHEEPLLNEGPRKRDVAETQCVEVRGNRFFTIFGTRRQTVFTQILQRNVPMENDERKCYFVKCEKQTIQILNQIPQNAGTHKYLYDANTPNCDIHLCITILCVLAVPVHNV